MPYIMMMSLLTIHFFLCISDVESLSMAIKVKESTADSQDTSNKVSETSTEGLKVSEAGNQQYQIHDRCN